MQSKSKNDDKINNPEVFYLKIKNKNGIKYEFQENKVLKYIKKYNVHGEFIVFSLIGKTQCGKSKLAEILTGVKHEIGELLQSETEGATIAYGGTIKDIYTRIHLEPPEYKNQDTDVFFIDTEGIFDDSSQESMASLIIPLWVFSSKIVAFFDPQPDVSLNCFLSYYISFIVLNEKGKSEDHFHDKIIVRIRDFPPEKVKEDVEYYANLFEKKSDVAKHFNNESLYPIYAPGGPYNQKKQCHEPKFNKYFLDQIFFSFLNSNTRQDQIVYCSPEIFVENVRTVTNLPFEN
ncbi:hypothetical protein M9Y10_023908 [Tritrichomonas musculus]|uniref:Guanylate-binding protein N-terminal domain-containing protein n=1 Tax=Tritrichomonas musculus TaxID=1915356 RepID=A0ABR2KWE4_9EUKA